MATTQSTAMPPFIMGQPPNRIPPVGPRWHVAKIVIRSFSLLFAIIAVILSAVLAAKASLLYNDYYGDYFFVYICSLPSCILIILWDLAEFITLCARRQSTGRGIHPGAHVGVDLIVWLQLCILWGLLSAYIQSLLGYDYWDYDTQSYIVTERDITAHNLAVAIITFMILISIIHFFLFVRACIETNQRNRMKDQPIYIIQGPPVPGASQQHPYGQIPGNMNGARFYYAPQPMQQKSPHRAPAPMMTPAVPQPALTHVPGSAPSPAPQIPPLHGYYAPSPTRSMEARNFARPTPPISLAQAIAATPSSNSSVVPAPESEPPKVPIPKTEPPAVAGPSNSTQ